MNRLVLMVALLCLFPGVFAQSCNEVTQDIRNINSNALIDYPLLNDVKQDMLLVMYGRERGNCPSNVLDFAELTRDFIVDFDEAYVYANSDLSEDNLKAVTLTRLLKNEADSLSIYKGAFGVEGDDLIISAQQVVDDFLLLQANTYSREAETTEVTIRKIQFYRTAALAYESAGNSLEASNSDIKAGVLEENYYRDLQYANSLYSGAVEGHSNTKALAEGDVFSKTRAYVFSRRALLDLEEAKTYFIYHHETEKITAIENKIDEVKAAKQSLIRELLIYFGGTALLLTALALFMVNRINVWQHDSEDHLLGNELVQVSKNEM